MQVYSKFPVTHTMVCKVIRTEPWTRYWLWPWASTIQAVANLVIWEWLKSCRCKSFGDLYPWGLGLFVTTLDAACGNGRCFCSHGGEGFFATSSPFSHSRTQCCCPHHCWGPPDPWELLLGQLNWHLLQAKEHLAHCVGPWAHISKAIQNCKVKWKPFGFVVFPSSWKVLAFHFISPVQRFICITPKLTAFLRKQHSSCGSILCVCVCRAFPCQREERSSEGREQGTGRDNQKIYSLS